HRPHQNQRCRRDGHAEPAASLGRILARTSVDESVVRVCCRGVARIVASRGERHLHGVTAAPPAPHWHRTAGREFHLRGHHLDALADSGTVERYERYFILAASRAPPPAP